MVLKQSIFWFSIFVGVFWLIRPITAQSISNHDAPGPTALQVELPNDFVAFGEGVLKADFDPCKNEFFIDVKWEGKGWGIGCDFELNKNFDGRKLESIQVEAKTLTTEKTVRLFLELSTQGLDRQVVSTSKGQEISKEWREFTFPISEGGTSRIVDPIYKELRILGLRFSRPAEATWDADTVSIRNLKLIFRDQLSAQHTRLEEEKGFVTEQDSILPSPGKKVRLHGIMQFLGNGISSEFQDFRYDYEIFEEIDWEQSEWGFLGKYQLKNPIDGRNLEAIQVKVKSLKGSQTTLYAGVSTNIDTDGQDANLVLGKSRGRKISQEWQTLNIPIASMRVDKPEKNSKDFEEGDWAKIEFIKLFFTKACRENATNTIERIGIRDLELIFSDTNTAETLRSQEISPYTIGEVIENSLSQALSKSGENSRGRSMAFLKAAGQFRDLSDYEKAINQFENAIEADPLNAYVYQAYGDFFSGYRGLYEQAERQFIRAMELVKLNPDEYEKDEFKNHLERSVQIWHRDGKDGFPLLLNYDVKDYAIYVEPSVEYRKPSTDDPEKLSLYERSLGVDASLTNQVASLDGRIDELILQRDNALSLFDFLQRQADIDTTQAGIDNRRRIQGRIPFKLIRRREETETKGSLLIRLGDEMLPISESMKKFTPSFLKLEASRVEIDNQGSLVNEATGEIDELEGELKNLSLRFGRSILLFHDLDMNWEASFSHSELVTIDPKPGTRLATQKTGLDFSFQSQFTYYFDNNTLKFTLGGDFAEIDRKEGNGPTFDDTRNGQNVSIRLSRFTKRSQTAADGGKRLGKVLRVVPRAVTFIPKIFGALKQQGENASKFRGVRSDNFEIGFRRSERDFEKDTEQYNYQPSMTIEFLGLSRELGFSPEDGHLDLIFNYNSLARKYTSGILKGTYETHQVRFIPTFVPIFKLYDELKKGDSYFQGMEFFSLGFPTSYTFEENNSEFSRFSSGIKFESQFVVKRGVRLIPAFTADFAYYPELDKEDWGVFAKCILRY